MNTSNRFVFDVCVAGGLVVALLFVIILDKLLPSAAAPAGVQVTTTTPPPPPPPPKPLRLAITPSAKSKGSEIPWDDVGRLLDSLGQGYKHITVQEYELLQARRFDDFDVLFLTCAPGGTERELTRNLRSFVEEGGTLYASDWRFDCVAAAFSEFTDFYRKDEGQNQELTATVLDPGLKDVLGSTVPLRFDMPQWKTASFLTDKVKVLLEGRYKKQNGLGHAVAPLLVKFQVGKGTVIFTSFHNEKQNSDVETKLLKFLVFSAVTAQAESKAMQTMVKGGFSPQKSNLLSASSDNPSVTQTYHSKKKGRIRFDLAFDPGARLKLTVVSPQGKKYEQEGDQSLHIEAEGIAPGPWQYTITALHVPYPNYPFSVVIGEPE